MGIGFSSKLSHSCICDKLKTWSWDDINSLQNNFSDEIYGFALDREVVRNFTKFNEQELSELFDLLDCSDSEVINAITMFITFYLLGKCDSFQLTVGKLFDLFDFSRTRSLNINEMTLLMFCLARSISCILSQPETCPTDLAMYNLVVKLTESVGRKGQQSLTRADFTESLTLMVNKLPKKTIESIYSSYLQSKEETSPEDIGDDLSISSIPLSLSQSTPQQHQRLLVEPYEPVTVPASSPDFDKSFSAESTGPGLSNPNSVLSMLDEADGGSSALKLQDEDERSIGSKDSIQKSTSRNQSAIEPKGDLSTVRPVSAVAATAVRPSSASSLRDKGPLAVLPPIVASGAPQSSPRGNSNQDPSTPHRLSSSSIQLTDPQPETSTEDRTSAKISPRAVALSPRPSAPSEFIPAAEDTSIPLPSSAPLVAVPVPAPVSVVQYWRQTAAAQVKKDTTLPQDLSHSDPSESGFLEISQISLSRLSSTGTSLSPPPHPSLPLMDLPSSAEMSGRYPFVELKLLTSDNPPLIKWIHRTELSLDSDEDALWYTQFRSPFSLSEAQPQLQSGEEQGLGHQLQLDVYLLEKLSPRLGSLEDSLIEEKRVLVGSALLSDCLSIFRKQMKWVQLIGLLQPQPQQEQTQGKGEAEVVGMYTVTVRYNPNPESTPRSLPPQLQQSQSQCLPSQSQRSQQDDLIAPPVDSTPLEEQQQQSQLQQEQEQEQTTAENTEGAAAEAAAEGGEYEYDSYYHEGGYYDHYTHAYLGNAYDHEAGLYYHDENIDYHPVATAAAGYASADADVMGDAASAAATAFADAQPEDQSQYQQQGEHNQEAELEAREDPLVVE